ncbi:DUF7532 family protein [Halobaculum limi]|uniref:DUF7532 family protein n=1 Tax=Halobaculum limi TaxID=3031916 RepID=UPI0024069079|nr:hypothetical protein [Halobaculum sp. YSMS11]
MHFDPREQAALREVGLDTEDLQTASDLVADAVDESADDLAAFFEQGGTYYSDMDTAHSDGGVREHDVDHLDVYTHAADLRGYLKFGRWGVPVEDGRVLNEEVVELTLGDTINDRVRFATDPEAL